MSHPISTINVPGLFTVPLLRLQGDNAEVRARLSEITNDQGKLADQIPTNALMVKVTAHGDDSAVVNIGNDYKLGYCQSIEVSPKALSSVHISTMLEGVTVAVSYTVPMGKETLAG